MVASAARATIQSPGGDVIDYREGGSPIITHKAPGRSKYEVVSLERGETEDSGFASWARRTSEYGHHLGAEVSAANLHKSITLEIVDAAGRVAKTYHFSNCWAADYEALPKLNANANAVAIQHIKLECEGFEVSGPPPKP